MHGCTPSRAARLLGVLVAGLVAVSTAAAPALAAPITGVATGAQWHKSHADMVAGLGSLREIGAQTVRTDFLWEQIQPTREGPWDFSKSDANVRGMAAAGVRPWVLLSYGTEWASAARTRWALPDDPADFARFGAAVAARYGRNGSFWAENPGLPALPATHFEVWNEQNARQFLRDQTSAPERYAPMYALTRQAIKAVDPSAVVTVGGLVVNGSAEFMRRFVAALPPNARTVDAVSFHPYAPNAAWAIEQVGQFRLVMNSLGLTGVPMTLSEAGFFEGPGDRAGYFQQLLAAVEDPDLVVTHLLAYSDNEWTIPGLKLKLGARRALSPAARASGRKRAKAKKRPAGRARSRAASRRVARS